MVKIGLIVLVLGMAGCASQPERWLTAEEDADLRAKCENANCVLVPGAVWKQIETILRTLDGTRI